MPQATLVSVVIRGGQLEAAAVLDEGPGRPRVEYVATVDVPANWQAMSGAEKRAFVQASIKAERDARIRTVTAVPITGSIDV